MKKVHKTPLVPAFPRNVKAAPTCVVELALGDERSLGDNRSVSTDKYLGVIGNASANECAPPVTVMGRMTLSVPADGAIATASGDFLRPAAVPPAPEVREIRVRLPHSPLRNGTALDGLVPNRPLENSLLERSALCPVEPPIDLSTSFTRCSRFERQLKKATEAVVQCEPHELTTVGRTAIAQFHQPKDKEISDRPLPNHMPSDPIDPVVIFVEAIPLAYRVLHHDPSGNHGLDLDGVAYIVERLGEAERLRAQEQDIRFDVLQALSALLVAIIEKAEEGGVACVKAA